MVDRERPAVQGAGIGVIVVVYLQCPDACNRDAVKVWRVCLDYVVIRAVGTVVQYFGRAVRGNEVYLEIADVGMRDVTATETDVTVPESDTVMVSDTV